MRVLILLIAGQLSGIVSLAALIWQMHLRREDDRAARKTRAEQAMADFFAAAQNASLACDWLTPLGGQYAPWWQDRRRAFEVGRELMTHLPPLANALAPLNTDRYSAALSTAANELADSIGEAAKLGGHGSDDSELAKARERRDAAMTAWGKAWRAERDRPAQAKRRRLRRRGRPG